jgi:hypothetical protein
MTAPKFTADIRLKPQAKQILHHLKGGESISPIEALVTYGNMRLAASIYEIRQAGYQIVKQMRNDRAGHGYARYSLKGMH